MSSEKEGKQKARERFLLDRFLECQGLTPTSIDAPKPPCPDFLIELNGRTIGIEITEIYPLSSAPGGQNPQQAIELRGDKIVSLAEQAYLRRNDSLLLVEIVFSNIEAIDKNEINKMAEWIADEIEDMASEALEKVDRRPDDFTRENPPRESVALIHIQKVPERRFARWSVPKTGLVHTLKAEHFRNPIAKKENKLDGYKKSADEVWLLMVADRLSASRKFHHPPDFPLEQISSRFSRTFYYCYGINQPVVEFS